MSFCKNCGEKVVGMYCSHCGQKAVEQRISFHYIWHEVLHFFTHFEKGFLFTSWSMLAMPGKVVTDFVKGKRKIYQPPVSFFLIWIAIYLLLLYIVEKIFGENVVIDYKEYFGPSSTTKFAISHLSFVLLVVIPFQALYFYLLVARKKYNYFESFVVAMYFLGTIILLQSMFVILAIIIHLITGAAVAIIYSDSVKIIYLVWAITNTIKLFRVKNKVIRIIVFAILAFGTFTVWRLYGVPAIIEWFLGES
jgi:Protein of unknown function (DUF3667)